jgi:hypothetical protein
MRKPIFAIAAALVLLAGAYTAGPYVRAQSRSSTPRALLDLSALERQRVVAAADQYLERAPQTVTAFRAERSKGGPHDFFSEGDYWWRDPKNPNGPYIRRDGQSNPDNFVEHRRVMVRLSLEVPALTAAWKVTSERKYADHARRHLRAWFVDADTRMNPDLQYAQAIQGITPGRGIGIIDTVHLVEVARAIEVLRRGGAMPDAEFQPVRSWFADYVNWMTTHQNGLEEREARNNHGTCWVMQVAAFASLTGDQEKLQYCRQRYKTVLLPGQMGPDGSFPLELARTKPYGYSLFNLDAMATVCQILSTPEDNLWTFELPDGRGMRRAVEFLAPYVRDKSKWPHKPDVEYFGEWPMRHPFLLFAGLRLNRPDYLDLWKTLKADSDVDEVIRNFFVRQPVLWVE